MLTRRCTHIALSVVVVSLLSVRVAWSQPSGLPVTVITDTMIADVGARTLKDLLVIYVPGMTFSQDHNEVTVATRGVFASAQQKVLIVVDGHVLNSRSYSASSPDFSISLDKIKRIDVLRGPASAVYGNGALAAVVSIVTKTALDTHLAGESRLSATAGNHGQLKVSGLYAAQTTKGSDLLVWGTYYTSDGETVSIPAARDYSRNPSNAQAILDGFKDRGSHDAGLKLQTRFFTFSAAHRFSKYIEPFTAGGPTGEAYVYADYQRGHGVGPGLGEESLNLGVTHERELASGMTMLVRGYVDRISHPGHLVSDPSQRAHSLVTWSEWDAGGVAQLTRVYDSGEQRGSWRAGVQADVMRVDDSLISSGVDGGWSATTPSGGLLALGDEQTYSMFAGATHPFGPRWSASAALRYDHKMRRDGDSLNIVSPLAGVRYQAAPWATWSVSFGRSFLDAPYFYRYNTLPSYRGARTLTPEYLNSFQVSPTFTFGNLSSTTTLFINSLERLVYRNNAAGPDEPIYQNAGHLRMRGLEQEMAWTNGTVDLKGNFTLQRPTSARNYAISPGDVHNVPTWSGNAIVTVAPPAARAVDLRVNATVRYIGAQQSPIDVTVGGLTFREPDRTVDSVVLVNIGARLGRLWSQPWFLDARVYNLFDTAHEQGGSVSHPYPQPGRWFTVTLGRSW
jgi:outer membrane receptor for ferrienterochelin and colicins